MPSRNNDPTNGLTLCKNAHWQFDQGLWTVSDDYRVAVASAGFTKDCPDGRALTEYHNQRLRLPADKAIWPNLRHIAWHRKNRFQAAF